MRRPTTKRPDLLLVQGQNKRWNAAAAKMREWLREPDGIGEMLGGECRFSVRLDLRTEGRFDALTEGLFFHAAASHQVDQLVAAKGLPDYVTARTHLVRDEEIGQVGVMGTAGGQALMEYANGAVFCYTGSRAGHINEPYAGWSGHWEIHGENGGIRRDGGRLRLYRKRRCVENLSLQDIHTDLVADEVIQLDAFARAIETGEGRDWLAQLDAGDLGADGGLQRVGAHRDAGGCEGDAWGPAGGVTAHQTGRIRNLHLSDTTATET